MIPMRFKTAWGYVAEGAALLLLVVSWIMWAIHADKSFTLAAIAFGVCFMGWLVFHKLPILAGRAADAYVLRRNVTRAVREDAAREPHLVSVPQHDHTPSPVSHARTLPTLRVVSEEDVAEVENESR